MKVKEKTLVIERGKRWMSDGTVWRAWACTFDVVGTVPSAERSGEQSRTDTHGSSTDRSNAYPTAIHRSWTAVQGTLELIDEVPKAVVLADLAGHYAAGVDDRRVVAIPELLADARER